MSIQAPEHLVADELHDMWEALKEERTHRSEVQSNIATLTVKVDTLAKSVNTLVAERREDRKHPWGTYISAMALVGAMLGVVTGPLYMLDSIRSEKMDDIESLVSKESSRTLTLVKDSINSVTLLMRDHVAIDGHPTAMRMHGEIVKDVERIDGDVEEMKDRDDSILAEIKANDARAIERLAETRDDLKRIEGMINQEKMSAASSRKMLDDQVQLEMRDLDKAVLVELKSVEAKSQSDMRLLDAILEERIAALERSVYQENGVQYRIKQAERDAVTENLQNIMRREQERRTSKVYNSEQKTP